MAQEKSEAMFNKVYDLIKNFKLQELKTLSVEDRIYCITLMRNNLILDNVAPITLLAMQGHSAVVNFYLLHFNSVLDVCNVIRGYAIVGNEAGIGAAISTDNSIESNFVEQALVKGYAEGLNFEKLNNLLENKAYLIHSIINFLTQNGIGIYHPDKPFALYFLAHIANKKIRQFITTFNTIAPVSEGVLNEANKLNRIMSRYQINFEQAQVMRSCGANLRLVTLQKNQSEFFKKLPWVVFTYLLTFITHLDDAATSNLSQAICSFTLNSVEERLNNKHRPARLFGRFFPSIEVAHQARVDELHNRYDGNRRIGTDVKQSENPSHIQLLPNS